MRSIFLLRLCQGFKVCAAKPSTSEVMVTRACSAEQREKTPRNLSGPPKPQLAGSVKKALDRLRASQACSDDSLLQSPSAMKPSPLPSAESSPSRLRSSSGFRRVPPVETAGKVQSFKGATTRPPAKTTQMFTSEENSIQTWKIPSGISEDSARHEAAVVGVAQGDQVPAEQTSSTRELFRLSSSEESSEVQALMTAMEATGTCWVHMRRRQLLRQGVSRSEIGQVVMRELDGYARSIAAAAMQ